MNDFTITNTNHKNLDGVRAIGILMVLVKHFYDQYLDIEFLWVSIDLLFALSGLLITGILIETKEDPQYFKKFYMRRILRIFPLYYLLIISFTFFVYFISAHPHAFDYYKSNWIYFYTYTQNWCYILNGMPPENHLNHTWSLAIDEQIYIFWPMLIWLCRTKKQLIKLCLGTLIFSLLFRAGYNIYLQHVPSPDPVPYFHNTFCRMDSFAAGSLLYCFLRYKSNMTSKRNMLILFWSTLLIFILFAVLDNSSGCTGYFMTNYGITIAGIHFTCWLYFAVKNNSSLLDKILGNRLLVYTGKISYSLYVFHWFLLVLLGPKLRILFSGYSDIDPQLAAYTAVFAITFITSMISYRYFEMPVIKLKKKFSYQH